MITQINATAFKGLRAFAIEPAKVNLLIGANGTGKTNFADLLEFISLISRFGLKEGFDRFDGVEEVRSKLPGRGRIPIFSVKIHMGKDESRGIKQAFYSFSLSSEKSIVVDEECLQATVFSRSRGKPTPPAKVVFDEDKPVEINFRRKKKKIEDWSETLGVDPKGFGDEQELILSAYGKLGNFRTLSEYLGSWRVYNIDSTLAKSGSNGNENELDRFGGNLIPFVKRAIENKQIRERLLRDLKQAVPYIQGITPEKILSYTTLKFSEIDSRLDLRAKQMSDGTIRLLGLLAILRQPIPPPAIVIEEPENALHSFAVKMFIRIAMELSQSSRFPIQVFFTSHSPTVVDHVLALESQREFGTQGFVTKRMNGAGTIEPVAPEAMQGIAKNLGKPSDFLREGSFGDMPTQLQLEDQTGMPI
jgi:predicted ATPase